MARTEPDGVIVYEPGERKVPQPNNVWTDPKPWVDRSEGDEYRHGFCAFPDAHGCTYEPRTKEEFDAEEN